jgi:hypothetical protein
MLRSIAIGTATLIFAMGPASGAAAASPAIQITSPSGGEKWCADSLHHVTWTGMGTAANTKRVKIELSTDGGQTWSELAAAPHTGRYLWRVSSRPADKCLIRLMAEDGKAVVSPPFVITASQEVKDYRWTSITRKAAFAPRDGAGALTYGGKMWLLGGWNPGDKKHFPRICNNEVWSSTDGAAWALVKPNTFLDATFDAAKDWEGRHTAGYVVHRGKMWIVGGDVNQGHYHFDVWNSGDGRAWHWVNRDKPVPWGPRALHYTAAFKDHIWVIGGQTVPQFSAAKEVFYRDIWTSGDGIEWKRIEPRGDYWPQRGMIGGSVVFQDRLWLLGGGTYDTPKVPQRKFFHDVWSTADGQSWTRHVELAPWEPRQYHEVAVFDGRMWVMEGYSAGRGNRNDVWYSADGVNWYELPMTPWAPRHAASVFIHDGALWMVAGNNMQSDVWKLTRK